MYNLSRLVRSRHWDPLVSKMGSGNIFSCTRPFLVFLKVFGFFPLTLNNKNEFKAKASDVAITFCAIAFIVWLDAVSASSIFVFDIESQIIQKIWTYTGTLSAFLQFFMILYQLWKCKEVARVITSLHKIDLKVIK